MVKPEIKNSEKKIKVCISICKRLRTKNSKQVDNGQGTVRPSDPNVTSGLVQHSISLGKRLKQKD